MKNTLVVLYSFKILLLLLLLLLLSCILVYNSNIFLSKFLR